MEKARLKSRFSQKASSYDRYALVQKEMAGQLQKLTCAAVEPDQVARLLEVGCGTAGLTRMLRRHFAESAYQSMDIARGMLEQAEHNLQAEGMACEFLHADIEEWVWEQPPETYDLIVSGACFQWLTHPAKTLRGMAKLLRPGAPLLFSTFGPATFQELHASFGYAHRCLGQNEVRHGLSFVSSKQWERMLRDAGMEDIRTTTRKAVLSYSSVVEFLHAVKSIGANASQEREKGLGQRKLLAEMIGYYERTYAFDHGIPVTYDLLYIQASRSRNLSTNMES